jgi:tetratricopeptide (TPR) repeat protein
LLVAALLATSSARAQEPPAGAEKKVSARAKLVEGDRLLKLGEFQQALAAFKDAYDLFPSPKIRYDFGLAYQGMGRNAEALDAFDAFLADATDAQPEARENARAARSKLLARVGTLRVIADFAGATIVIDGRDMGKTSAAHDIRLDPGPHLLLIDRGDGMPPFTQRLDVAAGALVSVVVQVAATGLAKGETTTARAPDDKTGLPAVASPSPVAPPAPGPGRGRAWRISGIATAAAGALCVGGGVVFGAAAHAASNDVSSRYDAARDSAGRRDETLQWVGYGLGAAAIAAGVWLFAHGGALDAQESGTSQTFNVMLGPGTLAIRGVY